MNQLKPIESRNIYTNNEMSRNNDISECYTPLDDFNNDQIEIFDMDDQNNDFARDELINHAWCNIDEANILPHRTRRVHGDTG